MARMTQRDQAHAYRFLARRQSSALVRGDPEGPDAPMRKLAIASFGSVMVALLMVAAAGVFGLLRPGGATGWRSGQALILEKETGTRFLYTGGQLHPVLNYASARLVLGQQGFAMVSVSQASLRGIPRGRPVGIPGAPDELPTPATLVTGPWSVCSLPAHDQAGAISPYVRVSAGPVVGGPVLSGNHGLLLAGLDGTIYLVWNDQRLRIPGGQAALAALGYASATPLVVGDAWLTAMPQGPDLAGPPVPGLGSPGPAVAGLPSRAGQVFVTTSNSASGGGSPQYYLAFRHGLAPISQTNADLMLAASAARRLYPPGRPAAIRVSAASVAAVAPVRLAAAALPDRPPALVSIAGGQGAVCAVYATSGNGTPEVRTFAMPASAVPAAGPAAPPTGPLGAPLADQVRLPAGDGAVVRSAPAPGVPGGTVYLVTSQGVKYPLTSESLLPSLGLAGVSPVRVPAVVLGLLRTGPTLNAM